MGYSKEVAEEMCRMKQQWGALMTREQIEKISDYHNDMLFSQTDLIKEQAYHYYLLNDGKENFHRRRCEIALYRVTGEISSFFVDHVPGHDYLMVDKVLSIAEEWRILEGEGLLPLLEDFDSIQELERESPPRSRAEILRGFMTAYKVRRDIKEWTTDNLNVFRHKLFKVRQGSRRRCSRGNYAAQTPGTCFCFDIDN
jgi:hypothetical protein